MNLFLWVLLSLFIHLALILPFIANWALAKPVPKEDPQPVQVHMATTNYSRAEQRSVPRTPTPPQKKRPKEKHDVAVVKKDISKDNLRKSHKPKPVEKPQETAQQVAAEKPPEMPSVDKPNENTPPKAVPQHHTSHYNEAPEPNMRQAEQRQSLNQNTEMHDQPPMYVSALRGIPIPQSVQTVGLRNFKMTYEVTIRPDRTVGIRLMSSSGSAALDEIIIDALRNVQWQPEIRGGQFVASTKRMQIGGDILPGSTGRTLNLN